MSTAGRAGLDMHRAEPIDGSIDSSRSLAHRSAVIGVPFVHQGADSTDEGRVDVVAGVGWHKDRFRRFERGPVAAGRLDVTNTRELREVIGRLAGFVRTRGIGNGPASAWLGFSVGADCGWGPALLHLGFGVEVRSWFGAIELLSASDITSFCLTSQAIAGNGREIVIEIHGVSGWDRRSAT
jgi:hypothetical protein